MVKQVTHSQLTNLIQIYYKQKTIDMRKIPLLVYGSFGLGKSAVVKSTAERIAKNNGRVFVEWNKLTKEEKEIVVNNPKGHFVLIDIRLSEFDASDFKLPDFKKDCDTFEFKSPYWTKILCNEESDGILFFDEMNLAPPLVISSTYKIIYDRIINESKIGENWMIIGAGNIEGDRAFTHELAPPVRDRGGEVQLISPGGDAWTQWATSKGIDGRIIGFINWKPSNLSNINFDDGQKFTTARGWERVSTLIRGLDDDYNLLQTVVGSAIGEGIGSEFVSFCKIKDKVKLDEIIKDPEKLREITEPSLKYFITSALAESFRDKKVEFSKIMRISEILDSMKNAEFVALLWRLCIQYDSKVFREGYTSGSSGFKYVNKYFKLISENEE